MSANMDVSDPNAVKDNVKEYYGKVLSGTKDLKTSVCTVGKSKVPKHAREALKLVHDGVTSKYYGCGTVVPECLEGANVLDLGSGSGQDCYVISKLVGEKGNVVGLDMTDEQLEVANNYITYHTEKYGFSKPNVRFVKGYIERLVEAGLEENSFDIIVSNCVINLSPDKRAVLKEAYRVLKTGGEMYFSDVYADRDLPEDIRKHKVLWGECISGALWWEDVGRLAQEIGFAKPLIVSTFKYDIGNTELEKILGDCKFVAVTYRLFKLPKQLESAGQVIYEGSVTECEDELVLDHHHTFKTGEVVSVDAEMATILKTSRFSEDFTFQLGSGGSSSCPKKPEMNPFTIADELGTTASCGASCGPSDAAGGCCPPKPSNGCCPPKSSDGCCPPKASEGSCAPKASSGCC